MIDVLPDATPDRRFPLLDLAVFESCIRHGGAPPTESGFVRVVCMCGRPAFGRNFLAAAGLRPAFAAGGGASYNGRLRAVGMCGSPHLGEVFRSGRPAACIRRGGAPPTKAGCGLLVCAGGPHWGEVFRSGRPAACIRRGGALPTEERPRDWLWLSVHRMGVRAAIYQAANQRDKYAEHSAQYKAKREDHRLLWLYRVG